MIKDSGDRTEFATGAVRDMRVGKGRCDLMPIDIICKIFDGKEKDIFALISQFKETGSTSFLISAIKAFCDYNYETMMLEVSIHFEEGAKKYGENNWQKGIDANCYIDSAIRHYLKYLRGDDDERHDRAFVWNLMCCAWTCEHKPELNTYAKNKVVNNNENQH